MASPQDEIDALTKQIAALTDRVYQLERATRVDGSVFHDPPVVPTDTTTAQNPSTPIPSSPPSPPSLPRRPAVRPQPALTFVSPSGNVDFEKKIGQYWLNRIGIVAILIGVSYFLKYAFENNWIGPSGRIAIGLLAGVGLVIWSERFRTRGYATFSYSLKAVGIGTLYLSLWGAFQVYHLIPPAAAFLAMPIVTASTILLAVRQDAELLATFALVGGFATPVLLSTGENHEAVLFSYVFLMDLAILAMAIFKPWRRLLWGSFVGTVLLYVGWYSMYFTEEQRTTTVCFAVLLAATFAGIPLVTSHERSTRFPGPSVTLTILPLLNAAAFFLSLYEMYEDQVATLAWFSLALAAIYLAIGGGFGRRFAGQEVNFIKILHVSIAITFITIAVPLKLDGQWITIGWLVESGVLLWSSVKAKADFLRLLAIAALTLGILRLLFFDQFHTEMLVFNARFATYFVAIGILVGIAVLGKKHATSAEMPFLDMAVVAANLLALIALTLEASDYFDRQIASIRSYADNYGQASLARDFSYSAIWLIYGAVLMTIGFKNRSAFVRWQSLVLIAFTVGKVFFYDVSQLGGSYRIVSFIGLGGVLLGISFIYQRDWLKLSSRSSGKSSQRT